jgi:hypothetical protein
MRVSAGATHLYTAHETRPSLRTTEMALFSTLAPATVLLLETVLLQGQHLLWTLQHPKKVHDCNFSIFLAFRGPRHGINSALPPCCVWSPS